MRMTERFIDSTVTADANDPDGDPLTYAWRAPDGRVTGSGPRVTWTAPTGVEGSYPVTVTVDDGRNNYTLRYDPFSAIVIEDSRI